ncbi:hypothetical protein CSUI_003651 [Cystoisospora suis]|uniref:Uncharacterized protein n=1 Tax=Cystoisospora suis TaxID=483139 RepID=A0A2C6L3H3_9APIC|nr:hypothetical protein CSUI_003651 [Cystoisospora suis]
MAANTCNRSCSACVRVFATRSLIGFGEQGGQPSRHSGRVSQRPPNATCTLGHWFTTENVRHAGNRHAARRRIQQKAWHPKRLSVLKRGKVTKHVSPVAPWRQSKERDDEELTE